MSRSIIEQQNIINGIIRFLRNKEGYGVANYNIKTSDWDSGLIIIDRYYDIGKDKETISRRYTFNIVDDKTFYKKCEMFALNDGNEGFVEFKEFDTLVPQDTYVPYEVIDNINTAIGLVKAELDACGVIDDTTIDLLDKTNKYIKITTRSTTRGKNGFVMNFNVNESIYDILHALPEDLSKNILKVDSIEPALDDQKFKPCKHITQKAIDSVRKFCATMINCDYDYKHTTQIVGLVSYDDFFNVICCDGENELLVIFTVMFTKCNGKYTGFKVFGIRTEED